MGSLLSRSRSISSEGVLIVDRLVRLPTPHEVVLVETRLQIVLVREARVSCVGSFSDTLFGILKSLRDREIDRVCHKATVLEDFLIIESGFFVRYVKEPNIDSSRFCALLCFDSMRQYLGCDHLQRKGNMCLGK